MFQRAIERLWCWLGKHDHSLVFVRLIHPEGPPSLVGPMDRYSAEVFMANRIATFPHYNLRPVDSARIIGVE